MKKLLLLLSVLFVVSCSSSDDSEAKAKKEAILGVDNLSEYLNGKYFKFKQKENYSSINTLVFHFQSNGKKNLYFFCGAYGEACRIGGGSRDSCVNECTKSQNIVIDKPTVLEYDDESRIYYDADSKQLIVRFTNFVYVSPNGNRENIFGLEAFSKKELDELKKSITIKCNSADQPCTIR